MTNPITASAKIPSADAPNATSPIANPTPALSTQTHGGFIKVIAVK